MLWDAFIKSNILKKDHVNVSLRRGYDSLTFRAKRVDLDATIRQTADDYIFI